MDRTRRTTALVATAVGAALVAAVVTQLTPYSAALPNAQTDATARIVSAAQDVAHLLDAAGQKKVQFPFESAQRTKWSNLPSPMFQRDGVRLADLTIPQRAAVMKLLTVALSREGYQKALEIMHGDEVLKQSSGGRGGPSFGEDQ